MKPDQFYRRIFISGRCAETIFSQRLHLARMAVSKGWQVDVGGDRSPGEYEASLRHAGFTFHPLPVDQRSMSPISVARLLAAYVKTLRLMRPTLFHAFTIKPIVSGLIGARLAGVPIRFATVTGLGHVFLSSSPLVRLVAFSLLRIAFRCADHVFFYNQTDRDEYVRRGIVGRLKTSLIAGSGIETGRFDVAPMPIGPVIKMAFVGRLLTEKGMPELLEAMRIVRKQKASVELHLVGDCDPNNPSSLAREAIDQAVAEGLVTWHGLVADVRPLVAAAHVVILPSHREGIPLALLEGAAMGRALIATDVPGCRDVVIHNKTGLLVPVNDPSALAEAIVALASDPERVRNMGQAAREDVVARFDTNIVNAKVVEVYEEAMKAHGLADSTRTSVS
jgi:glycosyltransferase involved in cell wall biosynthesis